MTAPAPRSRTARLVWMKRGAVALGVIAIAVVLWTVWDQDAVMRRIGGAGPLPFFAAMVLLPALGVPLTPFFVVAGATFGRGLGIGGSLVALALHLTLCYVVARSRLRPHVTALLRRFDLEIPDFAVGDASAIRFVVLVKLAPGVPGFVKHYGLGTARVPFGLYLGVAMLVTGAYGVLLVVLGESLFDHDLRTLVAIAVLGAALALGLWWLPGAGGGQGLPSSVSPRRAHLELRPPACPRARLQRNHSPSARPSRSRRLPRCASPGP